MAFKNKIIFNPVTGQSIRFLTTSVDSEGQLLEMETTYLPWSKEPAMHYHPRQEERFRVISGEISVRMDGKVRQLKAGDHLYIPRKAAHAMWNHSHETAIVNWKVTPAYQTEYFLETAMGIATCGKCKRDGMPGLLQVSLLAPHYAREFRLSKPPYLVQKVFFNLLKPFALTAGYKAVYDHYID